MAGSEKPRNTGFLTGKTCISGIKGEDGQKWPEKST